ncbi:hypothetical protein AtEden1_Chr3g0196611 [Arabidopsis thaliana]
MLSCNSVGKLMNNGADNGAFLRYLASCSCRDLNLENLNMFLFVYTELINADAEDASCSSTPSWRIKKSLTCVCFNRKRAYERICSNLTPLQVNTNRNNSSINSFLYDNIQFSKSDFFFSYEERLKRLRKRMKNYYDASRPDHQDALRAL